MVQQAMRSFACHLDDFTALQLSTTTISLHSSALLTTRHLSIASAGHYRREEHDIPVATAVDHCRGLAKGADNIDRPRLFIIESDRHISCSPTRDRSK